MGPGGRGGRFTGSHSDFSDPLAAVLAMSSVPVVPGSHPVLQLVHGPCTQQQMKGQSVPVGQLEGHCDSCLCVSHSLV